MGGKKKYAIRSTHKNDESFYIGWNGFNPCFGGTIEQAMLFDSKKNAESERFSHIPVFTCTKVVEVK